MTLKIEKIKEEKKKNKVMLLLRGSHEVFANTIRRMILEEVPTLAVENLEIKDNSSALYDEMLALRLGLIPIKTDLKSYTLKEQCKCGMQGCAQCELKITLKAGKKGYVYAEEAESADPKCSFVYAKMPIVKLLAKQKIDIIMTAVLGKGKVHAKWAPGYAYYFKEPAIKIGKVEDPENVAKHCSDGVFVLKNKKLELVPEKVYESQLLEYYSELDKGIAVEYSDNIVLVIESWGQLSWKEMLQKSASLLAEKIEAMTKLIE